MTSGQNRVKGPDHAAFQPESSSVHATALPNDEPGVVSEASYSVISSFPAREVEAAWRQFIGEAGLPSHYVTPEYFLEPEVGSSYYLTGDTRSFAVLALAGERVTGVLTGRRSDRELVSGQPHRPQLLLAEGDAGAAAEAALARTLLQEGRACRLITVYSWTPLEAFSSAGFNTTEGGQVFLLRLDRSDSELFRGFSARGRQCINQAERKGVEITTTCDGRDLEDLLEAFAETHCRHGLAARSRGELEQLIKLDRNRKLFLAKVEGRVVAGCIIRFEPKGLAEGSEMVSLLRARPWHPNEALAWKAIQWSRAQGCQAFSFGGNSMFSSKFGGDLVPIYRLRRDQTFLHRIDFSERVTAAAKTGARLMQDGMRKIIRKCA